MVQRCKAIVPARTAKVPGGVGRYLIPAHRCDCEAYGVSGLCRRHEAARRREQYRKDQGPRPLLSGLGEKA